MLYFFVVFKMNTLLLIIIILILIAILLCFYIGLFTPIKIKVSKPVFPIGGHFFYKFHQTQYSEARFAFREIAKFPLKTSFHTVGIYYDDPKKVRFQFNYVVDYLFNFCIYISVESTNKKVA